MVETSVSGLSTTSATWRFTVLQRAGTSAASARSTAAKVITLKPAARVKKAKSRR